MGDTWTYLFCDLVTDTIIAALPLKGVSFSRLLNSPGQFSGGLDLADPRVQQLDPGDAIKEGRTALYVDLNDTLQWGGIIWQAPYTSAADSKLWSISANEFDSYLAHRVQAGDYATQWSTAPGGDPMAIATQIVGDALAIGGSALADMAINQNGGPIPTADWVIESFPITQLQTLDAVMATLSQLGFDIGFDYAIDLAYDQSGNRVKTLNLSYPRRGRIAGTTGLTITTKAGMGYTYGGDATKQATRIFEVGQGTGGVQIDFANEDPITEGYPLLEMVIQRSSVSDPTVLAGLAVGDSLAFSRPPQTPTATIPTNDPDVPLGGFELGDDVNWIIEPDERFPEGMQSYQRIVGYTVTPADEAGISTVKFTFNAPPVLV